MNFITKSISYKWVISVMWFSAGVSNTCKHNWYKYKNKLEIFIVTLTSWCFVAREEDMERYSLKRIFSLYLSLSTYFLMLFISYWFGVMVLVLLLTLFKDASPSVNDTPQQVVTKYNYYETICTGLGYTATQCNIKKSHEMDCW